MPASVFERLGMLLMAGFSIVLSATAASWDSMLGLLALAFYGLPGVITVAGFALRQTWAAKSARVVTMMWLVLGILLTTVIALWAPYAYRLEFSVWLRGNFVIPVLIFVGSPTIIRYVLGRAYATAQPRPIKGSKHSIP